MRAARLIALALAAIPFVSACAPSREPDAGGPPASVLLVVVDTLRADRLGVYGFERPTSPHVDRFAQGATVANRYTTVVPTTLSSFTSILTGRYPHTHGVYRNGVRWPDGLTGVQGAFRDAGYETAAFIGSYCLGARFGLARGFDHFDEDLPVPTELPGNPLIRRAEQVTDAVLAWLDGRGREDAPFFALVHYFDPHWPYQPPEESFAPFDDGYAGPVRGTLDDIRAARERLARNGGREDADSRHLHDLHLGEIRSMDAQFGRLLEALERGGLSERTLVVFTADHGESFHEHGDFFDHGRTVYDAAIRVPLILRGPGLPNAGELDVPLASIDLAPFLLDYAALPQPQGIEGRSFLPYLRGEAPEPEAMRRLLFAEATKPPLDRVSAWPNRDKQRAVMSGAFKLIRTTTPEPATEIYDRAVDPDELSDCAGAACEPAEAQEWLRRLEAWSEIVPEALGVGPGTDPEVLEKLRSLGYVD